MRYELKCLYRSIREHESWLEVRYALSTVWHKLTFPIRLPYYGLRNILAYSSILYRDRDWDQSFLFAIMEKKFRRMRHLFQYHGHHAGDHRIAKQLTIAAECCRRLAEEDYQYPSSYLLADEHRARKASIAHESYLQDQDLEWIGKLLRKHAQTWWD